MTPLEYLGRSLDAWPLYAELLALSLFAHFFLIRRCVLSFFDPLFIVLLGSIFGWPIVWFMYFQGDIDIGYAVSFSASEIAFDAGMLLSIGKFVPPRERGAARLESPNLAHAVLSIAGPIQVAATLATWAIAGVPLFRDSRQGAFVGSGGFGVLERLSDACGLVAAFTAFYLLLAHKQPCRRWPGAAFLAWFVVALGMSGSKSALLNIGQVFFCVAVIYTNLASGPAPFLGGRAGRNLILGSVTFAILIIIVQFNGEASLEVGLAGLAFRLASFGDIYVFAYVNRAIEDLPGHNLFVGLFGNFLSTFRLFPSSGLYMNSGLALALQAVPDMDYITGPNPRHPILGYQFLGQGGFLLSLCLGLVTGALHRRFFSTRPRSFLSTMTTFLFFITLVSVGVDYEYSLSRIASVIISLAIILPPAIVLGRPRPRPKSAQLAIARQPESRASVGRDLSA